MFYFDEGTVHFFRSGDSQALAHAILDVAQNEEMRRTLIARGYEYAQKHGWPEKKQEYLNLVDSLSTERFDSGIGKTAPARQEFARKGTAKIQKSKSGNASVVKSESALYSLTAQKPR
jgi:hypothetical protein